MTRRMRLLVMACASAITMCAAPTQAGAEGGTFSVPATVDRTGTRDVTQELLDFFRSVPDGSTITFPQDGRYRVEGTLELHKRKNLTFEGNNALVFATTSADRNRRHWLLDGGAAIVFRDLRVQGANPDAGTGEAAFRVDREAQHGFDFQGTAGAELDHVTVTDVYGDFVYLGMERGTGRWASAVRVHDSHFERNGRQGISITAGRDVVIARNFIAETRRATFDIEPNGAGWGARNVLITNNRIGRGRLYFLASHGQGPVDDISIVGNTLHGRSMDLSVKAPEGTRRSGFTIRGNTSDFAYGTASGAAMNFTRVDGMRISDNVQPMQAGRDMVGVGAHESCDVVVTGNHFANSVGQARIDQYGCPTAPASPAPRTSPAREPAATAGSAGTATTQPTAPGGSTGTTVSAAPSASAVPTAAASPEKKPRSAVQSGTSSRVAQPKRSTGATQSIRSLPGAIVSAITSPVDGMAWAPRAALALLALTAIGLLWTASVVYRS